MFDYGYTQWEYMMWLGFHISGLLIALAVFALAYLFVSWVFDEAKWLFLNWKADRAEKKDNERDE